MGRGTAPRRGDSEREPVAAVVAIDGPSGSGKSTVARRVAQRLGYRYLDTGAMYRAVTWQALDRRVDLEDAGALAELAERAVIDPGTNPRRPTIVIDGVDVSAPIRTRAVTNAVSAVSAVPAVREVLVRLQRRLIADGGIVVEGRDIGTTVAPDAPLKVFLTASSEARAARRHRQLAAVGDSAAEADTLAEIERRDRRDSGREASPLAQAADAIVVDSTRRTVDEVVGEVLAAAVRKGLAVPRRTKRTAKPAANAAGTTTQIDAARGPVVAAATTGAGTPGTPGATAAGRTRRRSGAGERRRGAARVGGDARTGVRTEEAGSHGASARAEEPGE